MCDRKNLLKFSLPYIYNPRVCLPNTSTDQWPIFYYKEESHLSIHHITHRGSEYLLKITTQVSMFQFFGEFAKTSQDERESHALHSHFAFIQQSKIFCDKLERDTTLMYKHRSAILVSVSQSVQKSIQLFSILAHAHSALSQIYFDILSFDGW